MAEELIGFECMQKEKEHALVVLGWRNDPITLQVSLNFTTPRTFEEFYPDFLASYFTLTDLPSAFALWEGKRIAALRFEAAEHPKDFRRRCAEVSLNVAPEWRSKGFGTAILTQVGKWAKSNGYDALLAKIKKSNTVSIHAFEKAGFTFVKQYFLGPKDNEMIYEYILELNTLQKEKVFVIAEAGSNWRAGSHEEDLKRAYALIEAAKEAAADAIKFQVFRRETIYVKNAGAADYLTESGIRDDVFDLFKGIELPYEMIPLLAKRCQELKIQFLASTFSPKDFAIVDPYVTMHKIASYEISYEELIKCAADSKKPLLLSTGASTVQDIDWAVKTFRHFGGQELILMQCTASYPALPASMHLRTLKWLKRRYQVRAGLSDHSLDPFSAPLAAVALGAQFIEKHFTLSRSLPGPDHSFAIEPQELKRMVACIREVEVMLGSSLKKVHKEEEELYSFSRRGIQALQDIHAGEKLIEGKNIAVLRPGKQMRGVHPKHLKEVEGKIAKRFIALGKGIQFKDLE